MPRPKRVIAGFVILAALVFAALLCEGLFRIGERLFTGTSIQPAELIKEEKRTSTIITAWGDGSCLWSDHLYMHPYLSYVKHPLPPCGMNGVNANGFSGPEYPLAKEAGTFVVMLAGGSVAEIQAGWSPENNLLEVSLNRDYEKAGVKKVVVLSAAVGGWRQPQQLIAFALNSHILDAVVTLDGFNELQHVMEAPHGQTMESPSAGMVNGGVYGVLELKSLMAFAIEKKLKRWEFASVLAPHSHLFYTLLKGLRNKLRSYGEALANPPRPVTFHPWEFPRDYPLEWRPYYNIDRYIDDTRMMDYIARPQGIRIVHFMQPCPALGKTLTEKEKGVVGGLQYGENYRYLVKRMLKLNDEGIPVISLIDVFKDAKQTLYYDIVHVSDEGRHMLNDAIVKEVAQRWGFKRRTRSSVEERAEF